MDADVTGPRKILVVGCGGTISCAQVRETEGVVPTLTAGQLVAELALLGEIAEVDVATFSSLPSAHMNLDHVLRLASFIDSHLLQTADVHGVVITHGTDTLEEVPFTLDLMWRERPAARGDRSYAQLQHAECGWSGKSHCCDSHGRIRRRRRHGRARRLDDNIHASRYLRKSHTSGLAAFGSSVAGPLGYVAEGTPRIVFRPLDRFPLASLPDTVREVPVALLKLTIGEDDRLLRLVSGAGYRGLVVEGFGGGHVTREIAESTALAELVETVPVVLSTPRRCRGNLRHTYGFTGSEGDLLAPGLIPSGVLDPPIASPTLPSSRRRLHSGRDTAILRPIWSPWKQSPGSHMKLSSTRTSTLAPNHSDEFRSTNLPERFPTPPTVVPSGMDSYSSPPIGTRSLRYSAVGSKGGPIDVRTFWPPTRTDTGAIRDLRIARLSLSAFH